jgi:diguanylate cyclase (GGDEF)-like protein/PAS domain S-box-containing protein
VAAVLAVIAGMLFLADAARRDGDRAREAQVMVERVRSAAQRVSASTWQGLLPAASSLPAREDTSGIDAYTAVVRNLRALRRLGVPRDRMAEVEQRVGDAYSIGVNAQILARANPPAARRMAAETFIPAVARLDEALTRAARRQGQLAQAAQRRARTAGLSSLAGGLFLLAALAWGLHRIRRKTALAEHAREAERHGEERLRALVRHSSDVVAVIDTSSTVRWIAESVRGMLRYEPESLVGRSLIELVHPEDSHQARRFLEYAAGDPGRVRTLSLRLRGADGRYRELEAIADDRRADPVIDGILLNLRDVSERLELESRLRHQAFHDSLTGLPNRALFEDRLGHALARLRRRPGRAAVLFLDLDDFKTVNDSLGHAVGDELLRVTAQRLADALRAQDTAARLGGDEFAALLEDLEDEADALEVAERVRQALEPPVLVGGRQLSSSASIGIAHTDAGSTADELLRNADLAMYAAKERGKARVAAFEDSMHEQIVERLELTGELARAQADDELALVYQPLVDLGSGAMTGVEALLRWDHPTRGRLTPDRFIDLAESSGAIVPIGRWVLRTACAQLRRWEEEQPAAAELTMSVNVSTRQLADPAFPAHVRDALEETGIAPQRLTLEITEHLLVDDSDLMQVQLRELKEIGVELAVDDFGTGYSALSYMQSFPIDILKIDRSFVSGIDRDTEKAGLVRGIVEMGHNLRLKIVTEGIEEPEEAALLREFRSDFGQGFLFSRPVDAGAIPGLLADTDAFAKDRPVAADQRS